ncbi:MAG TPA: glycosyltransferase family 39 protein [Planctomycetota bacterium]|nr:glycosyltransferase family 39 protein [Planctomycetota bacterium]
MESPAAPAQADDDPRARRLAALAVAALCVLGLVVRLVVNAPRTGLNHGDVSFYYTVAKNLAQGRGFVIDYIWNFWDDPKGLPTPSNVWWMPLPSLICAAGMKLFGVGYAVAQTSMIVVTSVLPLVVYLLGRQLVGGRLAPLLGAALASTFHLFLDQPCAPLSHGPYVVLASLALFLGLRAARTGRGWIWAGAAIGATHMARSDGVVLFAALGLSWLVVAPRPRPTWWRVLLAAVAGYALVMSPWWAHNLSLYGALQPGGSFRAAFLSDYESWYSLPGSVTPQTWLADGWGKVWQQKRHVAGINWDTLRTGLVSGASDRDGAWAVPAVVAVLWLAWAGVLAALGRAATRRALVPLAGQALLEFSFYSLVFTAVGPESFRSGMYSLYPAFLIYAAFALVEGGRLLLRLLRLTGPRHERFAHIAAALVVAWIMAGQFTWARQSMVRKAQDIDDLNAFYKAWSEKTLPLLGPGPVIMARDVHELHALTGLRCVMIPYENEPTIRATAKRYGVTHILLIGDPDRPVRPALKDIDRMRWCELVTRRKVLGQLVRVYRIVG